ncbi:hypothetical protein AVEN_26476-1 [Araneus ventricosus]|uniref:Uncharacterized protein n=1 Tax=Araneus ventricosus TaxID=182803 RepID=A0A4Y2CUM9_ARAVE|nr:hypothetical protein AVEN_26476-1 [Araneus ventricosus]
MRLSYCKIGFNWSIYRNLFSNEIKATRKKRIYVTRPGLTPFCSFLSLMFSTGHQLFDGILMREHFVTRQHHTTPREASGVVDGPRIRSVLHRQDSRELVYQMKNIQQNRRQLKTNSFGISL